jgi:hypothetical protein
LGLDSRPDRGRPTLHGWWAPVALRYIKRWDAGGSAHEVHRSYSSHRQTLNPISEWGRCQRREAPLDRAATPPPSSPPPLRHHHDARAAVSSSSPTNEMAGTGSSSNATVPSTDGLLDLNSFSLYLSLGSSRTSTRICSYPNVNM